MVDFPPVIDSAVKPRPSIRMRSRILSAALMICLFTAAPSFAGEQSAGGISQEETTVRMDVDLRSVDLYRRGLRRMAEYISSTPEIFGPCSAGKNVMPERDAREEMRETWKRVLDYYLALESIRQYHRDFYRQEDKNTKEGSYLVYRSSFLAQYRFALEILDVLEENRAADTILNDPVPELGLPGRTYADFKFRFLNVKTATEFAALQAVAAAMGDGGFPGAKAAADDDASFIWKMGRGKGEVLTLKNALAVVGDAGQNAWLPVQKGVAEWMGDVKVHRIGQFLITPERINGITPCLEPGDILLERREWFLTNVGLPGFWTHAALYVGTPEERRSVFGTDEIRNWIRSLGRPDGDYEGFIRERVPEAYDESLKTDENGHAPRVIEAVGEGVIFTTIEHSAACDSLAVLRPRLPVREKARALLRAFGYAGRPYDFDFDFMTDAALVCSELVYKAYEPASDFTGVRFPLSRIAGRLVIPPNEMARMFADEHGAESRQTDLVLFLDGFEKEGVAVESSPEMFLESWKRPKWHVLVQESLRGPD